ncbi:hypothetical protein NLU13_5095 [Sarocladium strictum]|uniref:Dienelactone hydrolase domain-containing protein n=1 Tax=Sarocladium strictum TaxID=5046 RepID=A0AA39GK57_SARSR|nr:hypothetical protein NLU13_5095 [Sarocladium strictum]
MTSNPPGDCCLSRTLHEGTPKGEDITIHGERIKAYLARATKPKSNGGAILYIPDVFGIWQNSKLMADNFAERGYTTLIPDLFNGDVIPDPRPAGFDVKKWIAGGGNGDNPHTPAQIDPITVAGIQALKAMGYKKIAAVGYCFGAKYIIRHYKDGIDVGFVAHPSFVDEAEFAAIPGPLSIAAAETDTIFPAENRHKSEEILRKIGVPYQINLFSGTEHGFAVRGDPKVKSQKFAKERAFQQAVDWFDEHL